jgi:hypothetical protein
MCRSGIRFDLRGRVLWEFDSNPMLEVRKLNDIGGPYSIQGQTLCLSQTMQESLRMIGSKM